ncbi:hypothetical protein KUF83_30285 [Streptomyces sp. BV286]|uniref:hypothetical protein n=1 Tax=Streptomyces sp. BV286 TaxID=2849672 RepID=UPI001C2ED76F|nr:hypothetical protein [Streptomyces sp. BV286]MBV1940825.1 hypothetical protein [Streptomyces sp. BV286]
MSARAGTRTFPYDYAPVRVRVRVRGGEPVWFARDLAAAIGVPFPPGPLLPESPNALLGMATAPQVWAVVERSGCAVPDSFRAWMTDVSARVTAATPVTTPAQGPRPALRPVARPVPIRRTAA